jgi:hypothetical protein
MLFEVDDDARFIILRTDTKREEFEELYAPKVTQQGLCFEFIDENCEPGMTYRYRVGVDNDVERRILFETEPMSIPKPALALRQNYPNPFNPTTTISFTLPEKSRVTLSIYDVKGSLMRTLVDDMVGEGYQERIWDGRDGSGSQVSSGVYFYRLTAGKQTLTKKMVFLK